MIGIKTIASYIPPFRESNYDKKVQFEINDGFIEDKIGVTHKARKADDEETSDMCCRAFEALTQKININLTDIECLVVCTQNPDGHGLPHTAAIVHDKLNLHEGVAAFDISLGCSGYVYALSIVTSFMTINNLKTGLLFTADPYSKIVNPNDKTTSLLFGDAASVTLLSNQPEFIIEKALFSTRGKEHKALQCVDRQLEMKGRAIFNFSMTAVPIQIKKLLASVNYTLDDMDLIIPHQASKFLLDTLNRRLKLNPQKVPSNLTQLGNTISSSIPIILENYIQKPELKHILISGFGVGLSWATAILARPKL